MLDVSGRVVKRKENGPEASVTHHQGEPTQLSSFGQLSHRGLSSIHLNQLFPDLELHFSEGANEVTRDEDQNIFLLEIP